jgi:hypothetical protein
MNESTGISNFKFSPLKIFLILAVLLSGIYFAHRSGTNPQEYKNDFNVYYFASQEILAGRTPYENSLGEWTSYLYPPLLAELLVPFASLPLPFAAYLWFLLNAFSLFAALRMSARLVFPDKPKFIASPDRENNPQQTLPAQRWFTRLLCLKAGQQTFLSVITQLVLVRFVLDNFDYGQVNLLVCALAVAHIYFWINGKRLSSAIVLALAVSIKITPILLLAFHIAKLRLKFSISCLALIAAITIISFAPFGSQAGNAFEQFYLRTVANGQGFNLAYHGNQSLQGAIERVSGNTQVMNPSRPHIRVIAIGLLAMAFFAAIIRQNELAASLPFFCLIVLLSPLSWKQHFVILIFPITFLIGKVAGENAPLTKKLLLATLFMVFALFNLTSSKIIGIAAAEWCDQHSFIFVGAFALYLALILDSFSTGRDNAKTISLT